MSLTEREKERERKRARGETVLGVYKHLLIKQIAPH